MVGYTVDVCILQAQRGCVAVVVVVCLLVNDYAIFAVRDLDLYNFVVSCSQACSHRRTQTSDTSESIVLSCVAQSMWTYS